jgi:FtsH-binding integral membrane protein
MSGLITYTSVLLLTRKRLERIEKLLRGKVLSGASVNEIERQVLYLARQSLKALNISPSPSTNFDAASFTPWLAQGISKFAAMGAVGPEITRFAAQYAPGQAWLVDTLHRGNPDPRRDQVLARSTDFLLEFSKRISAAVLLQPAGSARDLLMQQMRAYALGHACHIAGAVVSAPFIDALEFEPGTSTAPPRTKLSVQAVRGAIEEGVARRVYNRSNPRGGDWNGWLPTEDEVPDLFFDAYSDAAAVVYGTGARVAGSKAFDEQLAKDQPPELSPRLLRDGYGSWRLLSERGYTWTYGDWLRATLFMFIPASLIFPLTALLPQGRHLRRDDAFFADKPPEEQRDDERALFEVLNFPLAANGLVPLIMSLWLMLGSYSGAGKETIFGVVNGAVVLVAAITFFATLHTDIPAWVRWLLLFAVPLALEIAHIAYVLARGGQDKRHWQLAMNSISHIVIAIFFVVAFVAFLHFGVEDQVDNGLSSGKFWGLAVAWLAIVAVLWLVISALLNRLDSSLPGVVRDDFVSARKHFLRLFDDTTLGTGPPAAPPATLAQRLFPNELEPVLKLWWTGAGTLFVRSDRDALVFAFAADGSGTLQTVLAPIAPMSAIEYGDLLKKAVQDNAGNFTGQLKVERFASDEPLDPQLGTGEVFADHGDDRNTIELQDTERAKFRAVPAADQEPYVLYLAPRRAAAIRMGRAGSVLPLEGAAALAGPGQITPIAAPGSVNVVGDAATRFLDTFMIGDVIETPAAAPNQTRVVTAVADDQHLTVNMALAPFAAAQGYQRRARDRETDLPGPGSVAADLNNYRQLVGTGTRFERDFMAGDLIRVVPLGNPLLAEERRVAVVLSPTSMRLEVEFSNAVPTAPAAGVAYQRPGRLGSEAFEYAATDPTPLFAGSSVLDRAADLATLLCLGTSSRLLLDSERAAVAAGAPDVRHAAVREAWQVFRNWNLDHRRVNEWRMLVTGNATSEKRGQPDRADALQPGMPAAVRTPVDAGEAVANRLGWVPLFTRWVDMAQRTTSDTTAGVRLRGADATNLELSRGLAYLLDLAEPV